MVQGTRMRMFSFKGVDYVAFAFNGLTRVISLEDFNRMLGKENPTWD